MLFDPIKNCLYTDEGKLIKPLYCPKNMFWANLRSSENSDYRKCVYCDSKVVDTSKYTDAEILKMASDDPDICVKVDFEQGNLRIKNVTT